MRNLLDLTDELDIPQGLLKAYVYSSLFYAASIAYEDLHGRSPISKASSEENILVEDEFYKYCKNQLASSIQAVQDCKGSLPTLEEVVEKIFLTNTIGEDASIQDVYKLITFLGHNGFLTPVDLMQQIKVVDTPELREAIINYLIR